MVAPFLAGAFGPDHCKLNGCVLRLHRQGGGALHAACVPGRLAVLSALQQCSAGAGNNAALKNPFTCFRGMHAKHMHIFTADACGTYLRRSWTCRHVLQ